MLIRRWKDCNRLYILCMEEMVNRNNAQSVILVGDNQDDRETILRFRLEYPDIPSAFVRVEGGGAPDDTEDSSVENVNQFLDLII